MALLELLKEVAPKLILDKDCHLGLHHVEKVTSLASGVKWHVAHSINLVIVFAHFIAAWRVKSEQNFGIGLVFSNHLNQWPALLKLTQR